MIRKIILLLILLFSNVVIGQKTESYNIELKQGEKFERILSPQQVYINSATKLGGKTRVYFTVNLPENTVRWFYVVTTRRTIFKHFSSTNSCYTYRWNVYISNSRK